MSQKMNTLGESIDDAAISDLVKKTLLNHRSTAALNIVVESKNGVVKVEGKAGNWDEINLVSKLVSDMHCVKMVFNNMTIDRNVPTIN